MVCRSPISGTAFRHRWGGDALGRKRQLFILAQKYKIHRKQQNRMGSAIIYPNVCMKVCLRVSERRQRSARSPGDGREQAARPCFPDSGCTSPRTAQEAATRADLGHLLGTRVHLMRLKSRENSASSMQLSCRGTAGDIADWRTTRAHSTRGRHHPPANATTRWVGVGSEGRCVGPLTIFMGA